MPGWLSNRAPPLQPTISLSSCLFPKRFSIYYPPLSPTRGPAPSVNWSARRARGPSPSAGYRKLWRAAFPSQGGGEPKQINHHSRSADRLAGTFFPSPRGSAGKKRGDGGGRDKWADTRGISRRPRVNHWAPASFNGATHRHAAAWLARARLAFF